MRIIRSFKTVEEIQSVLDFLEDYGYIAVEDAQTVYGKGRPKLQKYLVNPWVNEHYCPIVRTVSKT